MNPREESNFTICTRCNQRVISYPNKFCRRQFLFPLQYQTNRNSFESDSETSGNSELDKFIKETQLSSKYCDDFIEWIPYPNLKNIKFLTNGGNSEIYSGTWLLNTSSASEPSTEIILKQINDSNIPNEFEMHHKFRSQFAIPFYGITKIQKAEHAMPVMVPKGGEYAMIIRHAKYGDLRNYIRKSFSSLNWTNRAIILIELSKALNSLHQMNLVHKDFHCKNILVDEDDKIFISDFGLCQPINSKIVSREIQGVLPYIAPEVLRSNPYTKQSEVYSLSMIMWELTSNRPPFSKYYHDIELAISILDGLRPKIVEGTPNIYADIMQQCWSSDPLQRPDASLLPKLFEEMMEEMTELYKMSDDNIDLGVQPDIAKSSNENSTKSDCYVTEAYKYSLKLQDNPDNEIEEKKITKEFSIELTNRIKYYTPQSIINSINSSFDISTSAIEERIVKKFDDEKSRKMKYKKNYDEDDRRAQKLRKYQKSGKLNKKRNRRSQVLEQDDDDETASLISESEDSRYATQTYDFSLDDLNKSYKELQ